MKSIALFLTFLLFTQTALAGLPPTTLSGQSDTSKTTTFNFIAPNFQTTSVTGGKLLESGNQNLLTNPSFEHSTATTGWTTASGSPAAELTVRIHGKQSLVTSPSASTFSVQQSSTINAAQMAGVQFLAMVRVRTNQSGVQVCSVNDGTVSTTNCASVNSDSNWGLYKVPFIGTTTSNGIWIGATGSVTGNIYIDDAFVGPVDLKTDSPQIRSQSSTFTAGSTGPAATVSGTPVVIGSGNFTTSAGVSTASKDINLSISCTTTNSAAASTTPIIYINGIDSGNKSSSPATSAFIATASWSGIVPSGQTFYCVNGNNTASSGTVSILATNVVNSQFYSASCGANCVDSFSAKVSSTDAVTDENKDWINGNCTNATTGLSTCTFNSGIFTVAPNCNVTMSTSGTNNTCRLQGSATSSSVTVACITVTGSPTTADSDFNISCDKQGADFTATRTIVGSFNETMTAPGISKPKTCYYAFGGASATLASPVDCSTGTCVETFDSCNTITPPAFASAGTWTGLTIASGTFANSSFLQCSCTGFTTTTSASKFCTPYFVTGNQSWQSNSSGGAVLNIAFSTASNGYVTVKCEGLAP